MIQGSPETIKEYGGKQVFASPDFSLPLRMQRGNFQQGERAGQTFQENLPRGFHCLVVCPEEIRAPEHNGLMEYERELALVVELLEGKRLPQGPKVLLCTPPTWETLEALLSTRGFHWVHWIGHASLVEGEPYLEMCDLWGRPKEVPVWRLLGLLRRHPEVRGVVLNGCHALGGAFPRQEETGGPGPWIMGFEGEVTDQEALAWCRGLYGELAASGDPGEAFQSAVREWEKVMARASTGAAPVCIRGHGSEVLSAVRTGLPKRSGWFTYGQAFYPTAGCLGRAREWASLYRALECGTRLIQLSGPSKCGKSTFATAIAERFAHQGYAILGVQGPATGEELLRQLGEESQVRLMNLTWEQRLSALMRRLLFRHPILLIFDGWETRGHEKEAVQVLQTLEALLRKGSFALLLKETALLGSAAGTVRFLEPLFGDSWKQMKRLPHLGQAPQALLERVYQMAGGEFEVVVSLEKELGCRLKERDDGGMRPPKWLLEEDWEEIGEPACRKVMGEFWQRRHFHGAWQKLDPCQRRTLWELASGPMPREEACALVRKIPSQALRRLLGHGLIEIFESPSGAESYRVPTLAVRWLEGMVLTSEREVARWRSD